MKVEHEETDILINKQIVVEVVNGAELTIRGTLSIQNNSSLKMNNGNVILAPKDDLGLYIEEGSGIALLNDSLITTATDNVYMEIYNGSWQKNGVTNSYYGSFHLFDNTPIDMNDASQSDGFALQPYYGFFSESGNFNIRLNIRDNEFYTIYSRFADSSSEISGTYRIENETEVVLDLYDGNNNILTDENQIRFTIQEDGNLCLLYPQVLGEMYSGSESLVIGEPIFCLEQGYRFNGQRYGFPFTGIYEIPQENSEIDPITVYLFDDWNIIITLREYDEAEQNLYGFMEWIPEENHLRLVITSGWNRSWLNREIVLGAQMSEDKQDMILTTTKGSELIGNLFFTLYNVD